jgi:hypothetical protein
MHILCFRSISETSPRSDGENRNRANTGRAHGPGSLSSCRVPHVASLALITITVMLAGTWLAPTGIAAPPAQQATPTYKWTPTPLPSPTDTLEPTATATPVRKRESAPQPTPTPVLLPESGSGLPGLVAVSLLLMVIPIIWVTLWMEGQRRS